MHPHQSGYTLIELMIVIAIVGILASFAIPKYQDYLIRARVTDGLNTAELAKMAVSETIMMTHAMPVDQNATGFESPPANANVAAMTIAKATGVITIQFTPAAGDGTLLLVPQLDAHGEITWTCKEGTLAGRFRPMHCR